MTEYETSRTTSPTIFIVDDEHGSRLLLNDILTSKGYLTRTFSDGTLALQAAQEEPPDLILLDVLMPDMDGFEVCRLLKENQATRFIPVVMITCLNEKAMKLKGIAAGADEFISKPIDTTEILLRTRNLLLVKEYHDFLKGHAEILEQQVRLRTEELQKKNVEIEQFIYTISHDLRSPLVTVKTFMGYLEKDLAENDQERISEDKKFIHNAADKMKLLLDELLEISRIGRVETPPVRVSLMQVLAEILDTLAGVIKERTIDLHLPDTDLMLFGDRPRLCQIWQNLIENAIKYSRDGSIPRIELGVRQENGETVFFVKDYGIGIAPEYHTKIFGIFEKLDPKSPGAGLGLSMVQRIVEKCGGRIWVESEGSDKGSCFFFTLPQVVVQS
jgi:signal transduction histidine kinase